MAQCLGHIFILMLQVMLLQDMIPFLGTWVPSRHADTPKSAYHAPSKLKSSLSAQVCLPKISQYHAKNPPFQNYARAVQPARKVSSSRDSFTSE